MGGPTRVSRDDADFRVSEYCADGGALAVAGVADCRADQGLDAGAPVAALDGRARAGEHFTGGADRHAVAAVFLWCDSHGAGAAPWRCRAWADHCLSDQYAGCRGGFGTADQCAAGAADGGGAGGGGVGDGDCQRGAGWPDRFGAAGA